MVFSEHDLIYIHLFLDYIDNECIYSTIEGKRVGSKVFISNQFCYVSKSKHLEKEYLVCRNRGCKASAETSSCFLKLKQLHNHKKIPEVIEELEFKSRLKELVADNRTTQRQVFNQVSIEFSEISQNFSFSDVQRSMESTKARLYPIIPRNCDHFCQLISNQDDLGKFYSDFIEVNGEKVASLFFSPQSISIFQNFHVIGFDGTFLVCPKPFKQLFTIFNHLKGRFFPIIFCLMTSKRQVHYEAVLQKIKQLLPQFQPMEAISDFESSSKPAFAREFPGIRLSGCLFHFKQALVRHLNENGMKCLLKTENLNYGLISSLASLFFLKKNA